MENIRRIGEVAKLMTEAGLVVLCAFISPFRAERHGGRELLGADEFIEIFVDTPRDVCIARDAKGNIYQPRRMPFACISFLPNSILAVRTGRECELRAPCAAQQVQD